MFSNISSLITNRRRTLRPAALGIDIGSSSTKITLATLPCSEKTLEVPSIQRVAISSHLDHEERRRGGVQFSNHSFVALAHYNGRELKPGAPSLSEAENYPLKTIVTHLLGAGEAIVKRLPGGEELVRSCRTGVITRDMEERAIHQHLQYIVDAAKEKAADCFEIKSVILTYPNYLNPSEEIDDWETYRSYFLKLIRPFFDKEVKIFTISEGQAVALYIIQPFKDNEIVRAIIEKLNQLRGPDRSKRLNLVVVDHGGSTLNIQSQTLFFNKDGSYRQGQSVYEADWKKGTQGGCQTISDEIKKLILRRHPRVGTGLAHLMEVFELNKWEHDWGGERGMTLMSGLTETVVSLNPRELRRVYNVAHGQGMEVLEELLVKEVIPLSKGMDFAIIFCGGSYCLRRLRQDMVQLLGRLAAENDGREIKHTFLVNLETTWPSAVSAGAALSLTFMPKLNEVLRGSRIGIQRSDEEKGSFLFGPECGRPMPADLSVSNPERRKVEFVLICEPNSRGSIGGGGAYAEGSSRPLHIDNAQQSLDKKTLSTYDLGWFESAERLPPGKVRFAIKGRDLRVLGALGNLIHFNKTTITFALICCRPRAGRGTTKRHRLDKKWVLTIGVDPASKLLVMYDMDEFPMWCSICGKNELKSMARHCAEQSAECKSHYVCADCYEKNGGLGDAHRDHAVDELEPLRRY